MAHRSIVIVAGTRYGRLTAVSEVAPRVFKFDDKSKRNRVVRMVECRCDCGRTTVAYLSHLRSGATVSCGCLRADAATVHGKRGLLTYEIWKTMRQRCSNPRNRKFPDYGGRGISVCERWVSFEAFLEDMGECPPGHSIDRYPDNNGNYEPGNCRWATALQQGRNKRNSRLITYQGKTRCLSEWAEETGIKRETIRDRIDRLGWTVERALGGKA